MPTTRAQASKGRDEQPASSQNVLFQCFTQLFGMKPSHQMLLITASQPRSVPTCNPHYQFLHQSASYKIPDARRVWGTWWCSCQKAAHAYMCTAASGAIRAAQHSHPAAQPRGISTHCAACKPGSTMHRLHSVRPTILPSQTSPEALLPFASLVLPIGAMVDTAVCAAWLALTTSSDATYRHAIVLQGTQTLSFLCLQTNTPHSTGIAAFIELASEPLYLLSQAQLRFDLRARAETAATLTKTLTTLALLHTRATAPILACCWAQVAFGGATLWVLAAHYGLTMQLRVMATAFGQCLRLRWPAAPGGWGVWWSFTLQAGEKLLLAKGSSLVITVAMNQHQQVLMGLFHCFFFQIVLQNGTLCPAM